MKPISLQPAALALALSGVLGMALVGLAAAQSKPTAAQQKELDAARADVERAAEHLAELSSKFGSSVSPIRVDRRVLRKPVIGVVLAPDDSAGVRIAAITPDSAAADAGLQSGDRIISINGKQINALSGTARVDQSRELLESMETRTPVKLAYFRSGKNQTVMLTPKVSDRLIYLPGMAGNADNDVDVRFFDLGEAQVELVTDKTASGQTPSVQHIRLSGAVAPSVRREVIRLGADCKGNDCKLPVLAEAFRWNGLNLASIDDGLGRYFGTSAGVLVLSTGKELDGLQAGDVIQKIDGKTVDSPRQAMEALRAQPAAAKVRVEYMRDRKHATAQVTVPKALPFRIPPPPPRPPMPPVPPMERATTRSSHAAGKPTMVYIERNGRHSAINGNDAPPPPAPEAPPPPPPPRRN